MYAAETFVSRLIRTKFTDIRLYFIVRCPQDALSDLRV